MPESKKIPTISYSICKGDDVEIHTLSKYENYDCGDSVLPNIKFGNISEEQIVLNNEGLNGGDLYVIGDEIPEENDLFLEENGNLIIVGVDANKYSINSFGELIYTNCE